MKIFSFLFSVLSCVFFPFVSLSQVSFSGEIRYKVSVIDTSLRQLIDDREMLVFTNDTLSRVNVVNDALGEQVRIKHMVLKKSYLLMDMLGSKLAIQTDLSESTVQAAPYSIRYKFFGRKKINGFVLKKAIVFREDLKEPRTIWYFKSIRPDILDVYDGIKGLPADYFLGGSDGVVHYSVFDIEQKALDKNLFGVPTGYERITLEHFMERIEELKNTND